MLTRRSMLIGTIALLALFGQTAGAEQSTELIGKVLLATGQPQVERSRQQLPLKRNDYLYQGDTLVTPGGARLLFRLADGSRISLAENSSFSLDHYRYEPAKQQADVRFGLLKGAFRALTGAIGRQPAPKLEIDTPVATIGIRGTEFWGGFLFSEALDVTMLGGKGIYIRNAYGQVDISQAGLGTSVRAGQPPAPATAWPEEKLQRAAAATPALF
ncbi:FecR family protein [Marinobacterium arenosum]|uniref:FecR family protein n=1 Tax=Marinobacterium arenosum TaxID=2862496 RepID=UPI001C98D259|nr:FecR family protein [Marinobacterium arenosum]MBY4678749.1 FecR family protein [Marinobacterium arenosum]